MSSVLKDKASDTSRAKNDAGLDVSAQSPSEAKAAGTATPKLPKLGPKQPNAIVPPPCSPADMAKADAEDGSRTQQDDTAISVGGEQPHLPRAVPFKAKNAAVAAAGGLAAAAGMSAGKSSEKSLTVQNPRSELQTAEQRGEKSDYRELEPSRAIPVYQLPGPKRKKHHGNFWSFLLMVLVPTIGVGCYYYFIAANQYVSEFRFSVLQSAPFLPGQVQQQNSIDPSSLAAGLSGLTSIMGAPTSASLASTQDYLVVDYLKSRGIVYKLQKDLDLKKMFSKPSPNDWWARFPDKGTDEDLYKYWQWMVDSSFDQVTGLARVQIRTFSPEDALKIANAMISSSEDLINLTVNKPNIDLLHFAEDQAREVQRRLDNDNAELKAIRDKYGMIDPKASVVPTNIQQIQTLQMTIIQLDTQVNAMLSRNVDKDAPVVSWLRAQAAAAHKLLDTLTAQVATQTTADGQPLSEVVGHFEKLSLDVQYQQQMMISTGQAVDQARANAAAKHFYLSPYVEPHLVETASEYPKRILCTFIGFLLFFGLWMICILLHRAVTDHAI